MRVRTPSDKPAMVDQLAEQLRLSGHGGFEREYRFHPTRKWRIDIAFVSQRLAVEYEGGTWLGGGHNLGGRYHADVEKYNALAIAGWTLIRCTADMVRSVRALQVIEEAIGATQTRELT